MVPSVGGDGGGGGADDDDREVVYETREVCLAVLALRYRMLSRACWSFGGE